MLENVVRIAKLGEAVKDISVAENATVGEALTLAGYDATGYDLRINNLTASLEITLRNGDVVTLVPAIRGGC